MSKNLTTEFCKLLNVVPGEFFKIKFCDGYEESENLYYIDSKCTFCIKTESDRIHPVKGLSISDLISGYIEIIKIPWRPKFNEDYWTIDFYENNNKRIFYAKLDRWANLASDYAILKSGWCYKTQEEAAKAIEKIKTELYKLGLE